MNRIIITQYNDICFFLVYEDDILVECHPLVSDNGAGVQIGNIYLGRVQKKVKNINSAFISLDGENIGYLPLDDKPAMVLNRRLPKGLSSIAENDLILVQVEQEPQKLKQARVTGNLSVSGKYVAINLNEGQIGVSKKIANQDRVRELRELINISSLEITEASKNEELPETCSITHDIKTDEKLTKFRYGLIYRTACENADNKDIIEEYERLSNYMTDMIIKASHERKTGIISREMLEYISIMEAYGFDRINEIKTDIPEVYEEIISYFDGVHIDYAVPNENVFVKKVADEVVDNKDDGAISISMYEDKDYPYYKLLGLETEIGRLLNKKVWLKSGGFLIIEPTEAMVVIDVNTGKSIGKKNRDAHILKINMEAAIETAKQLRLRNLSGIIMVDFINMESEEDKQKVVSCLRREFAKDKVSTHFIEITKLDVFEITRKKQRRPLHEILHRGY